MYDQGALAGVSIRGGKGSLFDGLDCCVHNVRVSRYVVCRRSMQLEGLVKGSQIYKIIRRIQHLRFVLAEKIRGHGQTKLSTQRSKKSFTVVCAGIELEEESSVGRTRDRNFEAVEKDEPAQRKLI